jgi:hypothetical protein
MILPIGPVSRPVPTGCDRRYAIGNDNAEIERKKSDGSSKR